MQKWGHSDCHTQDQGETTAAATATGSCVLEGLEEAKDMDTLAPEAGSMSSGHVVSVFTAGDGSGSTVTVEVGKAACHLPPALQSMGRVKYQVKEGHASRPRFLSSSEERPLRPAALRKWHSPSRFFTSRNRSEEFDEQTPLLPPDELFPDLKAFRPTQTPSDRSPSPPPLPSRQPLRSQKKGFFQRLFSKVSKSKQAGEGHQKSSPESKDKEKSRAQKSDVGPRSPGTGKLERVELRSLRDVRSSTTYHPKLSKTDISLPLERDDDPASEQGDVVPKAPAHDYYDMSSTNPFRRQHDCINVTSSCTCGIVGDSVDGSAGDSVHGSAGGSVHFSVGGSAGDIGPRFPGESKLEKEDTKVTVKKYTPMKVRSLRDIQSSATYHLRLSKMDISLPLESDDDPAAEHEDVVPKAPAHDYYDMSGTNPLRRQHDCVNFTSSGTCGSVSGSADGSAGGSVHFSVGGSAGDIGPRFPGESKLEKEDTKVTVKKYTPTELRSLRDVRSSATYRPRLSKMDISLPLERDDDPAAEHKDVVPKAPAHDYYDMSGTNPLRRQHDYVNFTSSGTCGSVSGSADGSAGGSVHFSVGGSAGDIGPRFPGESKLEKEDTKVTVKKYTPTELRSLRDVRSSATYRPRLSKMDISLPLERDDPASEQGDVVPKAPAHDSYDMSGTNPLRRQHDCVNFTSSGTCGSAGGSVHGSVGGSSHGRRLMLEARRVQAISFRTLLTPNHHQPPEDAESEYIEMRRLDLSRDS